MNSIHSCSYNNFYFITKRCCPDKVSVQGTGATLRVSDERRGQYFTLRVCLAGQNFDQNPHPSF